jgi:6-phosphogluconolactonase (cycloisomerase 2 family)
VTADDVRRLLIGGYTDDAPASGGAPYGLVRFTHDRVHDRLSPEGAALHLESPSYLALHPHRRLAYAVAEFGSTAVTTVAYDDGLEARGRLPIPGDLPCHLTISVDGRTLIVANYGDGTVLSIRLDEDGLAAEIVGRYQGRGSGPHPRQDRSHAHHVQFGPDGALWVVDLGADVVRRLWISPDGTLSEGAPVVTLPPGTGPRQLRLAPGGRAYVLGELSGEVVTVDTSGTGRVLARTSAWLTEPAGDNLPAHLLLHGRQLYASHRGHDRIVEFDATSTHLRPTRELPTGAWPRHFAIDGSWLYVASQLDDRLTARLLRSDADPREVHSTVHRPTCVLLLPTER